MRTPLLLLSASALLLNTTLRAQESEIPGETPGDLGWMLYGDDTLYLVRAEDGHVWMRQDLGADTVGTAYADANAYGALYQWGRWTDGHEPRTSGLSPATVLSSNDPSGLVAGLPLFLFGVDPNGWWGGGAGTDTWEGSTASATNGIDPCAALGAGWQLPGQTDWYIILAQEGITDAPTAFASNLRLVAGGSRDGQTGTFINVGQYSNYWSTTPNGPYAKDLTIGPDFVNADDDGYRSHGMSVRCLNKSLHVGIAERSDGPAITLFPNPSTGTITVQAEERMSSIVVYDALARVVATVPVAAPTASIVLPDLSNGLYTVRVETANGTRCLPLALER
jgi:hypothetical protein